MSRLREWRLAVLSLAGLVIIGVIPIFVMRSMGVRESPDRSKTATLQLPTANSLVPGAKVLLRGIPVGTVLDVDVDTAGVVVRLSYDRAIRIPQRSAMKIGNLTGLGESYLLIEPSASVGPYYADGARIPAKVVSTPASFGDMASAIARLLSQLNPKIMASLMGDIDRALPADPYIAGTLDHSLTLLGANLMASSADLTQMIDDIRQLVERPGLAGNVRELARQLGPTGSAIVRFLTHAENAMNSSQLPVELTDGLIPLVGRLQKLADGVAPSIRSIASSLVPAVQSTTQILQGVDVNRLVDAAVASVAKPGSVTVRLDPPVG